MSYYEALGLNKEPFSTSPDPAFFYRSSAHSTVIQRLEIAIRLKRGLSVILGDVVVTQPTAGVFKGFSSVCPHAGCNVSKITDGKIVCPCHNSEFNLDGSVAQGPAKEPLTTTAISVRGDSIVAG